MGLLLLIPKKENSHCECKRNFGNAESITEELSVAEAGYVFFQNVIDH